MSTPPTDAEMAALLRSLMDRNAAPRAASPAAPAPALRRASRPSAIVTQAQLDRARPVYDRAFALALIGLSAFGSASAAAIVRGGMDATAIGAGVGIQVVCSVTQYIYRDRRLSLPYALAFGVSTGTSWVGFWPIFAAPLMVLLALLGVPPLLALGVALWIVGSLAAIVDLVPEPRLVN